MPGVKTIAWTMAFLSSVVAAGSNGKGMFDGNGKSRVERANRLKSIIEKERLKLEHKVHLSKGEKTELLFKHMIIQKQAGSAAANANGQHAHRFSALKKIAPEPGCPDLCKSTWAELETIYDEYLKCTPSCPQNLVVKKVMKSEEVGEVCSKDLVCWGKLEEDVFKVGRSSVTGKPPSETTAAEEAQGGGSGDHHAESNEPANDAHGSGSDGSHHAPHAESNEPAHDAHGSGSDGSHHAPGTDAPGSGSSDASGPGSFPISAEVMNEIPDAGKHGGPCVQDSDCEGGQKCVEVPAPEGADSDAAAAVASALVAQEDVTNDDIDEEEEEEKNPSKKGGKGGKRSHREQKAAKGGEEQKSDGEHLEETLSVHADKAAMEHAEDNIDSASEEESIAAFKHMDTNGNGVIEHSEAMHAFLFVQTSSSLTHSPAPAGKKNAKGGAKAAKGGPDKKGAKGGVQEAQEEIEEAKMEEKSGGSGATVKICIRPDQTEIMEALNGASKDEVESVAEELAKEVDNEEKHDMDCSKKAAKGERTTCRKEKRAAQATRKAGIAEAQRAKKASETEARKQRKAGLAEEKKSQKAGAAEAEKEKKASGAAKKAPHNLKSAKAPARREEASPHLI
jgi:hypothetical protein